MDSFAAKAKGWEIAVTGTDFALDAAMCIMWITTYALLLIGTVAYRRPLIPLDAQAMIASFEIAVVVGYFLDGASYFNYAIAAYILWSLLELSIIIFSLKFNSIKKKYMPLYLALFLIMIIQMTYLVVYEDEMFRYSYVNTIIGVAFWFIHILRKDYPMKPIALAAFFTKLIADILGAIVYFGEGDWLINAISILLPVLDCAFIVVYMIRIIRMKVIAKN